MEVAENDVDAGVDLKENLEKQAEFQHKIVHLDGGKLNFMLHRRLVGV